MTVAAQPVDSARSSRVALVPLDDRPICLQLPVLLGEVADTEVITPPRGVLGRFHKTGDGDAIARWLDGLDLTTLDAVVVSTDMLAYGGLAGSRVPRVFEADARRRLEAVGRLKQRRPGLRVYAFSTIFATAPDNGTESDAERQTRARNHAINLSLAGPAFLAAIDYLVFSPQSGSSGGVEESRSAIAEAISKAGAANRVVIHPGADHVAMLLLARAVGARFAYSPAVQAVYSSTAARETAATVAAHVATAGARLADRGALQLFVYASRHENPDQADAFAARVAQAVNNAGRVVVADVDLKEDMFGAWLPLVEGLRTRKLLPRLYSYASSNTTEDTLGTSLAHALLYAVAVEKVAPASVAVGQRVASAQVRALLHRFINDFLYLGVVRGQTIEDFAGPRNLNAQRLDESGRARVEKHLVSELKPLAESLSADFTAQPWRLPSPAGRRSRVALTVKDLDGFEVSLPWGRMVEAEIRFGLTAQPLAATPRPPAPRVLQ